MALTIQSSGPTLSPRNPTTSRLAIFALTAASSKVGAPGFVVAFAEALPGCDAFGVAAEPDAPGWPRVAPPVEVPPGPGAAVGDTNRAPELVLDEAQPARPAAAARPRPVSRCRRESRSRATRRW